jgi:hypothetical protein
MVSSITDGERGLDRGRRPGPQTVVLSGWGGVDVFARALPVAVVAIHAETHGGIGFRGICGRTMPETRD